MALTNHIMHLTQEIDGDNMVAIDQSGRRYGIHKDVIAMTTEAAKHVKNLLNTQPAVSSILEKAAGWNPAYDKAIVEVGLTLFPHVFQRLDHPGARRLFMRMVAMKVAEMIAADAN